MRRARLILAVVAGGVFVAHAPADDVSASYQPLFLGVSQPMMNAPYLVRVENKGRTTKGELTVSSLGGSTVRYPVDLPAGSKKDLIVQLPSGYDVVGRLATGNGSSVIRFSAVPTSALYIVGVSDSGGILNFLRSGPKPPGVASAEPGLLPERASAYIGCSAVVLGQGAERMSDAAVAAIQNFVMLGGQVVLVGGASTPLLRDPRFAALVPIRDPVPLKVVPNPGETVEGLVLQEPFTMTTGVVKPGSVVRATLRGRPFIVVKPLGLGEAVFVSVNPFETPVSRFLGKRELIGRLGLLESGFQVDSALRAVGLNAYRGDYRSVPMGMTPGQMPGDDPFSVSGPSSGTILAILLLYAFLAVPCNFLVLRRLRRGELAWVTTPVISLVFAGIFFRFASSLYGANLSTASRALIIADEGAAKGYSVATTELYVPSGGTYNLEFTADCLLPLVNGNIYAAQRQSMVGVDNGVGVTLPDVALPNLAFLELGYSASVPGKWLRATWKSGSLVTFQNESMHKLVGAVVVTSRGAHMIGKLAPGEARSMDLSRNSLPLSGLVQAPMDGLIGERVAQESCVVFASVEGYRPGPQIGNSVEGREVVNLVWVCAEGGRS